MASASSFDGAEAATDDEGVPLLTMSCILSTLAPLSSAPSAQPAPADQELPGAGDWSLALAELTAEADALTGKKHAAHRAALVLATLGLAIHALVDGTVRFQTGRRVHVDPLAE